MANNSKLIHGSPLHYIDTGSTDVGEPTLLLVHGFPLSHAMWHKQVDVLSKHTRVICPDLPGFGNSKRGVAKELSLHQFADDLAALLDELKIEKVVYCGLSMGGYIGWQFWKRHADRLCGLIACDTRAAADTEIIARGRRMQAEQIRLETKGVVRNAKSGNIWKSNQVIADGMIPKLMATESIDSLPDDVEALRQAIVSTDPETIAQAQLAMADRVDASDWLKQIDLPTLFVVGEQDQITPVDEMRTMSQAVKGSTFVEIENAGHLPQIESPEAFNQAILAFLSRLA